MFGNGTKPPGGNTNVSGKTSVSVVAGHELPPADGGLTRPARRTVPAWNHGGNNYIAAQPLGSTLARRHHAARDLVSESERQRRACRYAVVSETDVSMADAATSDLHHHLVRLRLKRREFVSLQPLGRGYQTVSMAALFE
jgi:hypothetical protein